MKSTPQRGSVFRLTLPMATAEGPEKAADTPSPGAFTLPRLRGLVIEDDKSIRDGMRHLLSGWGCGCDSVENIDAALAAARKSRPDVIISDYRLREKRTGSAAIDALRSFLKWDVPALLITGDTAPERLREAKASGVPLLHKPVAAVELRQALARATNDERSVAVNSEKAGSLS